jgi:FMN-dependent NADH-azoreductase
MKTILHIGCSPRGAAAESHRLGQAVIACLRQRHPDAVVVDRYLASAPPAPIDADYAISQGGGVDVSEAGSMAASEVLVRELEAADAVVIATPMHNFTVPAVLKAWIDHVVRVRRTFDVSPGGKVGLLADRPVFIAMSSGGLVSGEHARQPDFLSPYLVSVLGIIGLRDVTFFSVQGTAFGADYLAQSRRQADQAVREHFHL